MAYTQADIDALDAEIAAIRTVKARAHGDRSTTFRDLDELLKLRQVMVRSVAGDSGTRYASFTKDA